MGLGRGIALAESFYKVEVVPDGAIRVNTGDLFQ